MQHPLYQQATYLKSVPTIHLCPEHLTHEVAFAGRSNAGKSSALNVITSQKSLARTSKTPGRTQLINFFTVDDTRAVVDLPGYGYAKVNINVKKAWEAGLSEYIQKRQTLKGLILLMDCRMPPTDIDLTMLNWTQGLEMPVHVLLTKSDKLKKGPAKQSLLNVQKLLKEHYPHASAQLFSSLKREGLEQVWKKLDEWMEYQRPPKEVFVPEPAKKDPKAKRNPKFAAQAAQDALSTPLQQNLD
ncbi:ribosome biogenesis GTP-binding protein YihA/YsxC [Thiomicrorhabdus aquaedulcis]|uniref:ribosome biogenesis GTP-binding protein YihA/YsxC n=1 Tax=Thiomicrorhabdus aquaedulcis TaxID=2211106 RepID=UPI000FD75BD2|nr:ribosome biogenesis GTP-binding protein YihA/YsxC [Thiomicrorhabdus aquaedulcis]